MMVLKSKSTSVQNRFIAEITKYGGFLAWSLGIGTRIRRRRRLLVNLFDTFKRLRLYALPT